MDCIENGDMVVNSAYKNPFGMHDKIPKEQLKNKLRSVDQLNRQY